MRTSGRGTANLFNSLDKEEHRVKRRIIGPVIGDSSMRVFEPEMQKRIKTFLVQILRSDHQPINMTPRCERLAVDVIGQLGFGYPLNTQVEPNNRVVVEGITARGKRSSLYFFWPRLRLLETLFNMVQGNEPMAGWYKAVTTMIQTRMKMPHDAKHDVYSLASPKIGEPGLITKDLWAEATFFIAAGGSTTATALSGAFFYLSRNLEAYDRLAAEIRTTFASSKEIRQGAQLNGCKYLRAVIEETMRMSPSTLSHAWREQDPASVAKGERLVIDGHVIPPGTQFAVSQYALQHHEEYFPDPFKFNPERWLAPTMESLERRDAQASMRRAFAPFSIGDRACAGKPMAWLEMRLTIAHTLWYFDFKQATGKEGKLGGGDGVNRHDGRGRLDEYQLYDSVVVMHDGPCLVFEPYKDHWKDLELLDRE
ncbi:hypothetical protein N0V82_005506 [Gnomoniopsis sp. IMI 355080]|nr:hypothetical protein N0V82_005506 [Gnomoniopsis sp. IMI 355080]